ncbi:MAG: hypothetical protein HY899_05115 [Deltaproteobacteria bacterium]|nr:hypothetical protein [Deltaproteobacteria bacterium]
MESAQVSGKVFRFLSTMHPSLSKAERKRYAEYDPDKWYPWTGDIAAEFTDLVRRSPRDTSFARGFAYAAQKGLPEDVKMSAGELVRDLATLPGVYTDGTGSGFDVRIEGPGRALVSFGGMPGFTNACIVVLGELTQRLQAAGAKGLDVKHAEGCRLQGAEACNFQVQWSAHGDPAGLGSGGEARPAAARPAPSPQAVPAAAPREPAAPASRPAPPPQVSVAPASATTLRPPPPSRSDAAAARAVRPSAPATPRPSVSSDPAAGGGSAQDLFEQLRVRLLDAEQNAARHVELEARIAELEDELAAAGDDLDAARAEAQAARDALDELRRRIRELVG